MTATAQLEGTSAPEFVPPVPHDLGDTGLPSSLIEQLLLKILYFRGETIGRDLANGIGLRFSLIESMTDFFRRQKLVEVKASLGMGSISSVFALSDTGRKVARDYLDNNQYIGPAPVPLWQYSEAVQAQKLKDGWLTKEMLQRAYRHMVVSDAVFGQLGPALNSGKSCLIYGQPGNGKTHLVEALVNLDSPLIYVPYAIEYQGQIIQLFDPIYHQVAERVAESLSALSGDFAYDGRWVRCKRPFIMTGGELSLEMLDLSYNATAKIYDAPFQLKANNGIYLIDDFGRQKVSPAEVLNRWIIPMERRSDYLTFKTGGKMQAPFETFLVFSTNLTPESLGDEAFMRRIQYKMFLASPPEEEFTTIFRRFCQSKQLPVREATLDRFLETRYRKTGKRLRRCHPRDVVSHALDLISFERLPYELTDEVLDRAFDSTFAASGEVMLQD